MYVISSDELDALAERSLTDDFCADCGEEEVDCLYTVEDDDDRKKRVCPTCAGMYGVDDEDE